MEEKTEAKVSVFKKYKWLYLWIAAAALITFSLVMLINKGVGQNIVFYVTGILLILFCIIRFVPLLKTTRNRWAIVLNAIEEFVMLLTGVLMIVLTAKMEDKDTLYKLYPFLIGGVLYVRASVYFAETAFFGTKPEVSKFFISLLLITAGTFIMARYDRFTPESMRWLLGIAFGLCGVAATVDGIINYNNYRKLYARPEKRDETKDDVADDIEDSIGDKPVQTEIIGDNPQDQPQDYVN